MKPINSNTISRSFAECLGHSLTFGSSVCTADPFNNIMLSGYLYSVYDESVVARDFRWGDLRMDELFGKWHSLLMRAQTIAVENNHNPASYAILMRYEHATKEFSMSISRVFSYRHDGIEEAEKTAGVMTLVKFSNGIFSTEWCGERILDIGVSESTPPWDV